MTIREQQEQWEHEYLVQGASFSDESRGKVREEALCDIRTIYQRDRDRILHCKTFRRLKQKTQVFLAPEGDHYRTRLTHTLEVSQIARTISRALRLNEDLTEAIALGHDLGHTPFGHAGERALAEVCENGFQHNIQSIRVIEKLENDGKGLNLSWEVRDGILNHKSSCQPSTLEGKVVRLCDKIAYVNHDIDDAIRAGILAEAYLPCEYTDILGHSVRDRLNLLVHNIITNSQGKEDIIMSGDVNQAMLGLRKYMFDNVYFDSEAKVEEGKAKHMIQQLFVHYVKHVDEIPKEYRERIDVGEDIETIVCDYIAGMTDNYAVYKFQEAFQPHGWHRM